jgi:hypothetical protein
MQPDGRLWVTMTLDNVICSGIGFIVGMIVTNFMLLREGSIFGRRIFLSRRQFWLVTIAGVTSVVATTVLWEILVTTGTVSEAVLALTLVAVLLVVLLVVAVRHLIRAKRASINHE